MGDDISVRRIGAVLGGAYNAASARVDRAIAAVVDDEDPREPG